MIKTNGMRKTWLCCLVGLCLLMAETSFAQAISPQQLEQLKQLTPDQKRRLIDALGGASAGTSSDSSGPQPVGPLIMQNDNTDALEAETHDRIKPYDSIIIDFGIEDEEGALLDDVTAALGKNVYTIDESGYTRLPGAGNVLLAGLTPDEARLRLQAAPTLRSLAIEVYLLPVTPVGNVALKPFGYELFSGSPTTFAPATDIPVPLNYALGPGDSLSLLLFGQHNANYDLPIGRDGKINIPEIGPIAVAGMRFDRAREELKKRIEERYIGVNISLTLGELRSMRVFVLGDVNQPGSYTVSSLSTMTNALFVSGGISPHGSLRRVQLKRNNQLIGELDLYELLLKGNTKGDRRIQPGDVIYVPPVGEQVSIFGQVKRPAIYELKTESSLRSVLDIAGGLLPTAYQQEILIEKFDGAGGKTVAVADFKSGFDIGIASGDQIEVQSALVELIDGVTVQGHVKRPGLSQWRPGVRLLDVLPDARVFKVQVDQSYQLIRRVSEATGRITLIPVNWRAAMFDKGSRHNVELIKGDTIHVFSLSGDRSARIAPLVRELQMQASSNQPAEIIKVQGWVRAPGTYPFQREMRVSDLLLAAGSPKDNAFLERAELTRLLRSGGERTTTHFTIDLLGLSPGSEGDMLLEPEDVLTVKQIPLWREHQTIELQGEVMFPGRYSASRGERLSEVIRRAGGLTEMAFTNGSIFLREDLKKREQTQLKHLADRVRAEALTFDETQVEAQNRAQGLLEQLESAEPMGRLVIDLNLALQGDTEHDLILEDGDELLIPAKSQEVTVIGEVQYPTSHIYDRDLDQFSYIYKSGGTTRNADVKRIYVIRADGQVIAQQGNNWFRRSGNSIATHPGDTIVVPFDSDRISRLSLWSSVTQIVYNIGVAAAAVASF